MFSSRGVVTVQVAIVLRATPILMRLIPNARCVLVLVRLGEARLSPFGSGLTAYQDSTTWHLQPLL